jgi:hypothetical protein
VIDAVDAFDVSEFYGDHRATGTAVQRTIGR